MALKMTTLMLLFGVHIVAASSSGRFDSHPQNSLHFTAEEIVGQMGEKMVYRSLKGERKSTFRKSNHIMFKVMNEIDENKL